MTYRYKNSSDFRQSIMVGGKRAMLVPNDVIESDRELKYAFLERVDDKTPVTAKGATVTSLFQLQNKIEKIQSEANARMASTTEIEIIQHQIALLKEQMSVAADAISKMRETTDRRMSMLKSAVMTLQEDVYGIHFGDSGNSVDEVSNDVETFRS